MDTATHNPASEPQQRQSFLERIAEKLGLHAGAQAVYSEPVVREGITVIPVAKARWGFGGGGGIKEGKERGSGGGGGVQVTPIGYIELKDGQSQYHPIREPASYVPLIVASGVAGWLLLRALRKLVR